MYCYLLRVVGTGEEGGHKCLSQGTCWFIQAPQGPIVVTSFHVVGIKEAELWRHELPNGTGSVNNVTYELDPGSSRAPLTLLPGCFDWQADVALLEPVSNPILTDLRKLDLATVVSPGSRWHAEGFPALLGGEQITPGGTIQSIDESSEPAVDLFIQEGTTTDWQGLSGSAVLDDANAAFGIMTGQIGPMGHMRATSVTPVRRLLAQYELARLFLKSYPNVADLHQLERALTGVSEDDAEPQTIIRRLCRIALQGDAGDFRKFTNQIPKPGFAEIASLAPAPLQVVSNSFVRREELGSDASAVTAYIAAIGNYCESHPYLSLGGMQPTKNLLEVYVATKIAIQFAPEELKRSSISTDGLDIAELLRPPTNTRLLLSGVAGAGKSSALRQLARHAWAAPETIGLAISHLPLLVSLGRLAAQSGSLEARLKRALADEIGLAADLPNKFLTDWPVRTGRPWLILLDALDEVPAAVRPQFVKWLNGAVQGVPDARVVITSRVGTDCEDGLDAHSFVRCRMLPFTPAQGHEFAVKWLAERAGTFVSELERVRASDFRDTPLLLMIGIKVFLQEYRLPKRRAELYEKYFEILFREARNRGLAAELGERLDAIANHALARIAWAMTERSDKMSEQDFRNLAADYVERTLRISREEAITRGAHLLSMLAAHIGVFTRASGSYKFVHSTFQEFLAAAAIKMGYASSNRSLKRFVGAHWLKGAWSDVIVFLLGMVDDDLAERVLGSVYRPSVWNLLTERWFQPAAVTMLSARFVAKCLADGVKVSARVESRAAQDLRRFAQNSKNDLTSRLVALEALGQLGYTGEAGSLLLEIVRDHNRDEGTRARAALVFAGLSIPGSLAGLAAEQRAPKRAHQIATASLFLAGDAGGLHAVATNQYATDEIRGEAVHFLFQLSSFGSLIAVAVNANSGLRVQQLAMDRLAEASQARALVSIARNGTAPVDVRRYALASLLGLDQVGDLMNFVADRQLSAAVRDFVPVLLIKRPDTLAELAGNRMIDSSIRGFALSALVMSGKVERVIELMRVESTDRELIVPAVAELVKEGHIKQVVELAKDKRFGEDLRRFMIAILLDSGHLEAVQSLITKPGMDPTLQTFAGYLVAKREIELLASDTGVQSDIRDAAQFLCGPADDVNKVVGFALNPHLPANARAFALGVLLQKDRADLLFELIRDKRASSSARQAAILVASQGDFAGELAAIAVNSELEKDIRWCAIKALSEVGGSGELAKIAQDDRFALEARRNAVAVLGSIQAVDQLEEFAKEETLNPDLWVSAVHQLLQNQAASRVVKLIQDSHVNADRRGAAIVMLGNMRLASELGILARDAHIPERMRLVTFTILKDLGDAGELASLADDVQLDPKLRMLAREYLRQLERNDKID
jgi:hypothetical protein